MSPVPYCHNPYHYQRRLSREVMTEPDLARVGAARDILALFRKNEDLVNIGAYVKGANPKLDHAVERQPAARGSGCRRSTGRTPGRTRWR